VQVVNFGPDPVSLTISTSELQASVDALGSTATVMTSSNVMDENSFSNPKKVIYSLISLFLFVNEWPCFLVFKT
jgi:alpha-L-arabinofuranosidase